MGYSAHVLQMIERELKGVSWAFQFFLFDLLTSPQSRWLNNAIVGGLPTPGATSRLCYR